MNLMNQIRYLEDFDLPLMFSGCSVPEPLVLDDVISSIVKRCGLLSPLYSEPEVTQQLTALWFRTNQWNFEHLVNIILAEYSPIENTDRYSNHSISREDNGTVTVEGTDSRKLTHGGQDERRLTLGGTDRVTTDEDIQEAGTETHSGTDTRSVTNGGSDVTQTAEGGKDTTTERQGGSDTGSTTTTRAAFNTSTYDPYDKADSTTTYGRTDAGETNYGRTEAVTATYGSTSQDAYKHGEQVAETGTTARDAEQVTAYGRTETEANTYGRTESESGTRGSTESRSGEGLETYTEHTHGNIGVTTNQDMINQELELLRRFNIYDWIAAKYERDMCAQLY